MSRVNFPAMWGKFEIDTIWEDGVWTFEVFKCAGRNQGASTLEAVIKHHRASIKKDLRIRDADGLREYLIKNYTKAVLGHRFLMGEITEEEYKRENQSSLNPCCLP